MHPSGEVGRFEVDNLWSPPGKTAGDRRGQDRGGPRGTTAGDRHLAVPAWLAVYLDCRLKMPPVSCVPRFPAPRFPLCRTSAPIPPVSSIYCSRSTAHKPTSPPSRNMSQAEIKQYPARKILSTLLGSFGCYLLDFRVDHTRS